MPKLITKLVRRREACEALAICSRTFWRHWHPVFTDRRDPGSKGVDRRVFEDELAIAVEHGGGERAKIAVESYRRRMGRK